MRGQMSRNLQTGKVVIGCEKINCSYDVKIANFSIVKANFVN